jgi:DNA topoisomerase-2
MNKLTINDLIDTQYRHYANYDNRRSLISLADGLKITQRKVLHTSLAKGITTDYKVAQLASLTSNFTEFHHSEDGISKVIVGLAQDFVGSNNLNFLEPVGQFGSRLSAISASPRYIFTKLSKNFRKIFRKDDDIILEYLYEDGTKIEPNYFLPILPGCLLNSSEGIGVGHASKILSRSDHELARYIKDKLTNKPTEKYDLWPYFDKFDGALEPVSGNQYKISGRIERISAIQIKIIELPIGMYLDDIKKHLNKLIDSDIIKDYDDNSTEEAFDVDVFFQRGILNKLTDEEILIKLKLVTTITENLTCWLPNGKLKKFDNVRDIIDYFITFRLGKYGDRILKLLELVDIDIHETSEKIRFIEFYLDHVDLFKNTPKKDLETHLDIFNFSMGMLDLKMYYLTKDKIEDLNIILKTLNKTKQTLLKTTPLQLYLKELEEIL